MGRENELLDVCVALPTVTGWGGKAIFDLKLSQLFVLYFKTINSYDVKER